MKNNIFTEVQMNKVNSNIFDLSHDRKMSLQMGRLTPIHLMEVIPGDNIQMSTSQMLRMAPMIAPVMHSVNVYTHFFFVPNRIIWPNWEKFITGGEDGMNTSVYPFLDYDAGTLSSIADFFGLPTDELTASMEISALPFYVYLKVYNEYYRDQNLITPFIDTAIDGDNTNVEVITGLQLNDFAQGPPLQRAWQHDYFTSALPWTQKGPEATIPLGTTAPIIYQNPTSQIQTTVDPATGNPLPSSDIFNFNPGGPASSYLSQDAPGTDPVNLILDGTHVADLTAASAATIIDLRRAFKLQEWFEKNARGGSRYTESILAHFGVKSSDARLQRPEFLGGGSSPMTISEVLQTSDAATATTPQGNMAGHGISVGANNAFSYFAEEHGWIIGIMSIMPKTAYQQGIHRMWNKFDKFDYYWPEFAHIGEQPIYNKEIYAEGVPEDDNEVFGYTPRFAEYKFLNSSVHGEFRTTLDIWHMGRIFETRPLLNEDFINCDPTTRIFAVELENNEHIYCHIYHRIKARRKMPYFGNPKM